MKSVHVCLCVQPDAPTLKKTNYSQKALNSSQIKAGSDGRVAAPPRRLFKSATAARPELEAQGFSRVARFRRGNPSVSSRNWQAQSRFYAEGRGSSWSKEVLLSTRAHM